ncbi:hypothetical protein PUR57_37150 [Streptomyces sp. JV176]|uniref:hypothetical protein n=1 Tax=unclassified Streptomyces TaxID=2593676 RepID=UPI002E76697F|nr:hypothetical protein [Streptomyces sp. JV176]MEE1804242.1 hypothetical protein [Streptomyces sp. JV176]
MSIRHITKGRRGVAVAALAVTLALTVAGCGGGDNDDSKKTNSGSSSQPSAEKSKEQDTSSADQPDPNVKLAEVTGRGGLVLVVNQVKRDSGGFVTVQGQLKNPTDQVVNTSGMEGAELEVVSKNPNSVAGATLVDKTGKKRYYVLRDTESRCLCTTGLAAIPANGSTSIFMQFPAPPEGSTDVDLTLPSFAVASLKISG